VRCTGEHPRHRVAGALLIPGLASIGALWLGGTMVGAVATHLFVLHTSPTPAVVLGLLNAVVVYLRCDELFAPSAGQGLSLETQR
jgi:putative oxidoreductase